MLCFDRLLTGPLTHLYFISAFPFHLVLFIPKHFWLNIEKWNVTWMVSHKFINGSNTFCFTLIWPSRLNGWLGVKKDEVSVHLCLKGRFKRQTGSWSDHIHFLFHILSTHTAGDLFYQQHLLWVWGLQPWQWHPGLWLLWELLPMEFA